MAKTRTSKPRASTAGAKPKRSPRPATPPAVAEEPELSAEQEDPALEGQAAMPSPQMKAALDLPVERPAGLRALFTRPAHKQPPTEPAAKPETPEKTPAEPEPSAPAAEVTAPPEPEAEPKPAAPAESAATMAEPAPRLPRRVPDIHAGDLPIRGIAAAIGLAVFVIVAVALIMQISKERQLAAENAAETQAARQAAMRQQADAERELAGLVAALRQGFEQHGDSGVSADLEARALAVLNIFPVPEDAETRERRKQFRLDLADVARNRSDFKGALNHVRVAEALGGGAAAGLLAGELALEAGDCRDEARAQAARVLDSLAENPDAAALAAAARAQRLLAAVTTADAVEAVLADRAQRDLAVAELKAKGSTLSSSLRTEMNEDFQRREKKMQDALAKNDPGLMAEAGKEKEAFDQKFNAELKRREGQLQQEIAAALQPSAALAKLQETAVAAWSKAVALAEKAAAAAPNDPHARRAAAEVQVEFAGNLAAQQKLGEARSHAEKALATASDLAKQNPGLPSLRLHAAAASQCSDILRLQSLGVPADQVKALRDQSETLIRQAVEISHGVVLRIPDAPGVWSRLGSARNRLAALLAASGKTEEAAEIQKQATDSLRRGQQDGGLREAQFLANQRVADLRQAAQKSGTPEAAAALQAAVALADQIAALRRESTRLLLAGADSGAAAKLKSSLLDRCRAAPETQPWVALVEKALP